MSSRDCLGVRSLLVVLGCCVLATLADDDGPRVVTAQGKLTGHTLVSSKGREFFAFEGIPYAKPPVGPLRFKEPQTLDKFPGGEVDGRVKAEDCVQRDVGFNSSPRETTDLGRNVGSEDCLYLNVFTPQLKAQKGLLPVLFYIHGGAFEVGSGSRPIAGPELLLNKDIVLVTINYRLGPFGFLDLEGVRGNLGLKDQSAALKWTKENIHHFGGDPKMITIMGESAGAGSVHLHMSSPMSTGLFVRGITQSGTRDCFWAICYDGTVRKNSQKLASSLGCTSPQPADCLREKTSEQIMYALRNMSNDVLDIKFRPVIEDGDYEGAFLTVEGIKRPTTHDWITGVTSGEGLIIYDYYCKHKDCDLKNLNKNYLSILPSNLFYEKSVYNKDRFTGSLKDYYLGNKDFSLDNFYDIINMFSDSAFVYGHHKAMKRHAGKMYQYYYAHRGERSNTELSTVQGKEKKLANHADDLFSLFRLTKLFPETELNTEDENVSEIMVELWTNFVIYGEPTPKGSAFNWEEQKSEGERRCLVIDKHGARMGTPPYLERMKYWDTLVELDQVPTESERQEL